MLGMRRGCRKRRNSSPGREILVVVQFSKSFTTKGTKVHEGTFETHHFRDTSRFVFVVIPRCAASDVASRVSRQNDLSSLP